MLAAVCMLALGAAGPDDLVLVQGRVTGPEGKGVAVGASILAMDDMGHIVGSTTTNSDGVYKMLVQRTALHLDPKSAHHGVGVGRILVQLAQNAGSVLNSPIAGANTGKGGPFGGGFSNVTPLSGFSLASLSGQNPLKVLTNLTVTGILQKLLAVGVPSQQAQATAAGLKAGTLTHDQAVKQLTDAGVPSDKAEAALGGLIANGAAAGAEPPKDAPGALQLKVTLPGLKQADGVAQAFIIAPGQGKVSVPIAYMDPVSLEPDTGDGSSMIMHDTLLFSEASVTPEVAHFGDKLTIHARLTEPSGGLKVVVLAKGRNGFVELRQMEPGLYEATIPASRAFPRGEQELVLAAYVHDGRDKDIESTLLKHDVFSPTKAYDFNPALRASKNRVMLKLTVLEPNPG